MIRLSPGFEPVLSPLGTCALTDSATSSLTLKQLIWRFESRSEQDTFTVLFVLFVTTPSRRPVMRSTDNTSGLTLRAGELTHGLANRRGPWTYTNGHVPSLLSHSAVVRCTLWPCRNDPEYRYSCQAEYWLTIKYEVHWQCKRANLKSGGAYLRTCEQARSMNHTSGRVLCLLSYTAVVRCTLWPC